MKQQKLSTHGFILVEVTVGVVLFSVLMLLVLQSIGFMVHRTAYVTHRHKALCLAVFKAHGTNEATTETQVHTVEYAHPSIIWHETRTQSGDQEVIIYNARRYR